MTEFRFEKLDVWKKAMDWVDQIYQIIGGFPAEEKFGLASQFKRESFSVASNIAEGSGRKSNKDFGRFVEISYGSLMEAICQCAIAKRQSFITDEDFQSLKNGAVELSKMLSGLRSYLDGKSRDYRRETIVKVFSPFSLLLPFIFFIHKILDFQFYMKIHLIQIASFFL